MQIHKFLARLLSKREATIFCRRKTQSFFKTNVRSRILKVRETHVKVLTIIIARSNNASYRNNTENSHEAPLKVR